MYMYNALIPACRLCVGSVLFVAIHPIPKHMQHSTSPFLVCKKGDHQTCHHMSRTTNPWFPHTVEELVIWTVEREKSEGNGHLRCMMCLCCFYQPVRAGGSALPAGPKIALRFPRLSVCLCVYIYHVRNIT